MISINETFLEKNGYHENRKDVIVMADVQCAEWLNVRVILYERESAD